MLIQRFINTPISSNCYLIVDKTSKICVIIDPGSHDYNNELEAFIQQNNLSISNVILTHEHFDHFAGLLNLLKHRSFEILCSENTALALKDPKKNLSAFNDQMKPITINQTPTVLDDNEKLTLLGKTFHFLLTPGHSPGSICFICNNSFFSGDTILNQQKIRLNLPGSNKEEYKLSIEKIKKHLKSGMTIYPGHGNSFIYKEIIF